MDGLANNPILVKLQEAGQVVSRNRFLSAVQSSIMSIMALIMVGSIFTIINSVLGPNMLNVLEQLPQLSAVLSMPNQFTMNILAVWTTLLIGYHYARNLKMKTPLITMLNSLAVFLMVAGTLVVDESGVTSIDVTYLGAQGMFISFFVTLCVVRIEHFCIQHNVRIKMPDAVPPAISDSFSALIPLFFAMAIFSTLSGIVSFATGGAYTIPSGFMTLLQAPLAALTSLPGVVFLGMLATLMWCFGIHGSIVISSVTSPLLYQAIADNSALISAGQDPALSPILVWFYLSCLGGAGCTLSLAVLGLRSKSAQIKAVSQAGIIPGFFAINEPLVFGLPIMYNPLLCIPYILAPAVVMCVAYFAMSLGIISIPFIMTTSMMPLGLPGYFRSLDIRNAVFDYVMVALSGLIYYPFFKAYEQQLVAKERQTELEHQASDIQ